VMSAVLRGMRNPFRDRARAGVVVVLLALVIGLLALLVQTAIAGRQQIAGMEARVCTLIKLREAGASGTGALADRLLHLADGRLAANDLRRTSDV